MLKFTTMLVATGLAAILTACSLVNTPPSVSIQTPASNSSVSQNSLVVSGTAADIEGLLRVDYSINGSPRATANGTTNWSFTANNLVTGNNVITMVAVDTNNAEASDTVNVNYIVQPPQFVLVVNKSGSGTVTSTPAGITCGSDCVESYSNNTSVTLTAAPDSGSSFAQWGGSCSGTTPTCTLTLNQNQTATATFTTSNPPPTISIGSPINNSTTTNATIAVSGTAADDNSVASVQYSLNGAARVSAIGTTAWSFNTALILGANTIQVFAKDNANQESSASITVIRSQDPAPVITITNPANNSSTDNASMTVNGTATDNNPLTLVEYIINNGSRQSASGTDTWSFTATLNVGSNTITVFTRDSNATESSATITITRNGGSFSLSPASSNIVIAQGADALYYLNLTAVVPFNTPASALTLIPSGALVGTATNQVRVFYRTDLSTATQAAFVLKAGAGVPLGAQSITINATGGGVTASPVLTLNFTVVACSSGCP